MARIKIANNLFDSVGGQQYGFNCFNNGRLFLIDTGGEGLTGPFDLSITHNTALQNGNPISTGSRNSDGSYQTKPRFRFSDNIAAHNEYGVYGDGGLRNKRTIDAFFPDSTFTKNVFAVTPSYVDVSEFPAGNYILPSWNEVGFVDQANSNYRLASGSQYKNAGTDGKDIGVDIDALEKATAGTISGTWQTPYTGTPVAVPGTIEAEHYDNGGEGVAYHDSDAGNNGGIYRADDVDILARTGYASNNHVVNNAYPGEWLEYTINVQASGIYSVGASVASRLEGGTFHIEVDGADITGAMKAPTTGSWYTFQRVSKGGVQLTAGTHVLRLSLDTPGVEGIIADFDALIVERQLAPVADAYVAGGEPLTNFGTEPLIYAKRHPEANFGRHSYLKFDTSAFNGAVGGARLRLYGTLLNTTTPIDVRCFSSADTTWQEETLTWNTKPAAVQANAAPLASQVVSDNTQNQWYEWDVTSWVQQERAAGRNVITLIIRTPTITQPGQAQFNSKEAVAEKPQMVITP